MISPQSWKFSTVLLRICNISLGGRGLAGQARFVLGDFTSLPVQQSVQPISSQIINYSPFKSEANEGFFIGVLKILAAPISIVDLRFLKPVNLVQVAEGQVQADLDQLIKASLTAPTRQQLYKKPANRSGFNSILRGSRMNCKRF